MEGVASEGGQLHKRYLHNDGREDRCQPPLHLIRCLHLLEQGEVEEEYGLARGPTETVEAAVDVPGDRVDACATTTGRATVSALIMQPRRVVPNNTAAWTSARYVSAPEIVLEPVLTDMEAMVAIISCLLDNT